MEILTLVAIFFGPIVAVQVSQFLERRRQRKIGKEWVFKTLMRTRASALHPMRIEALNMIDVEFYGDNKKDKAVVSSWKLYLDNLSDVVTPDEIKFAKRSDLFLELLYKMALALGYEFDIEHIKNTSYMPQGHIDIENDQQLIRKGVIKVLNGENSLPMYVTNIPNAEVENQENIHKINK